MKNKLICLGLVVSLVIGIILLNRNGNDDKYLYLAMGDFVTSIEESYSDIYYKNNDVDEYNKFLSRKSMTSSDLLRMLSIDVYVIHNGVNESVSSLIRRSNMITISIGYNDVMNNVRYNSITNKYSYDEDVISRSVSMLQENIFNIVDLIYMYNGKVGLYILSSYYPYPNKDNSDVYLYERINDSIMEACEDSGARYIDISGVSDVNYIENGNFIPNMEGNRYIYDVLMANL